MPVLIRIAIRNLLEHKTKTLIIGIIVALGVAVLIVGNSLMDTAALGIRRAFIDNYTGHVMISGVAESDISLFGVQSPGGLEETPTLPDYETVRSHFADLPEVASITSQITGYATARFGEYEGRAFTLLFGIEPATYRDMFPSVRIVQGRDLEPGERGIVVSAERLDELQDAIGEESKKITGEELRLELAVGDRLRLTSFGNAGIRIRELPIVGIFEPAQTSEGVGADLISYVDAQSLRYLMGMTVGYKGEIEVADDEVNLLAMDDPDNLFAETPTVEQALETVALSEEDLANILGDTSVRRSAGEIDTGSWHFILLKLRTPRRAGRFVAAANAWLDSSGIPALAADWEAAAGPFATTADVIRTVFNVAIIVIGVVAVIIIMNTLVISVIERTSEIGTMRALGARKEFVWRMFLAETLAITVAFGLAGMGLALGAIGVLNAVGIPATNVFLRILFAGPALHPAASPLSLLVSLAVVTAVGFLAHIYPVSVALKIQPVRAIQTE